MDNNHILFFCCCSYMFDICDYLIYINHRLDIKLDIRKPGHDSCMQGGFIAFSKTVPFVAVTGDTPVQQLAGFQLGFYPFKQR